MLTSTVAYFYALADLKCEGGIYSLKEIDLIYEFTPADLIMDDELSWGSALLNYWFSIAMCEINSKLAAGIMDDAGVSDVAQAFAFERVRLARRHLRAVSSDPMPIAPPTYKAHPSAWAQRGYDVADEARPGDVVVYRRLPALYVESSWLSVRCIGGFNYGKCEINTLPSCLVQVRRI